MIIFFDLDSTITKIEGLDEIAEWKGVGKEIRELTELGMSGGRSFKELLPLRLSKISPSIDDFKRLDALYVENLVPDVAELIEKLKSRKIRVGIITGGFVHAMDSLIEQLGLERELIYANRVEFNESANYKRLPTGQDLIHDDGKVRIIRRMKKLFPEEDIVFIGDSVRDIDTKGYADKFIGFGGVVEREKVKKEADHFIYKMIDILDILDHS